MLGSLKSEVVRMLARVEPVSEEEMEQMEAQRREALEQQRMQLEHAQASAMDTEDNDTESESSADQPKPFVREAAKVGRNDACPCGSGKKYKQCHGRLA